MSGTLHFIDADASRAWSSEVHRRLREHLALMHARGEAAPTDEYIQTLWRSIALELYEPSGKPH